MGFLGSVGKVLSGVGQMFGIGTQRQATNAYGGQMEQAKNEIQKGYASARPELKAGMEDATKTAKQGYDTSYDIAKTGFANAANQLQQGGQEAIGTAKSGMQAAQGQFETAPMVQTRGELVQRLLGQGGYQPGTLAMMKAQEAEQAGQTMKNVQRSVSKQAGDATAGGLAAENVARGAAQVGADKAAALRNIDIENAKLAEEQQTGAIGALEQEATTRAGLSADEAKLVSDLQEQLATGTANLTNDQTKAMADMAAKRGESLAQLQKDLASGQAQLTVEEAKALAELQAGQGANQLAVQGQKGLFSSIFG
jgi:hypothetical protein